MEDHHLSLSLNAKALLKVLAGYLTAARPGRPQTYPTYKQVAADLGFHNITMPIGQFLQPRGLDELAEWTKSFNLPAITGLIVLQDQLVPGAGYFDLFNKSGAPDMYDWWSEEIRKSKVYDWEHHLE
jgi:hypothetical protein